MLQTIYLLAAIVLIPLLPALLIYRLLPNRTKVTGPFKGLQINLTGAFGGYFILVLLSFGAVKALMPDTSKFPKYEVYTLFGSIDMDGVESSALDSRLIQFNLYPRSASSELIGSDHFEWNGKIPILRDVNDTIDFPFEKLIVEYPGFLPHQIDLRSGRVDQSQQKVTFANVVMKRRPTAVLQRVELSDAR